MSRTFRGQYNEAAAKAQKWLKEYWGKRPGNKAGHPVSTRSNKWYKRKTAKRERQWKDDDEVLF